MRKPSLFLSFVFAGILAAGTLFAQTTGEIEKTEREIQREKLLRERLEKQVPEPEIEEQLPSSVFEPPYTEKVLIKKIDVSGVTLVPYEEVRDIVSGFENKELDFREMQRAADLITDAYRKRGYVTSRAYLAPQRIEDNRLEIKMLEGLTGALEIKGNRHFRTALLEKKITLKKGQPFNYNTLRRDLIRINERPDRAVRAVLMPGKEPQTTDVVLEVKDRLPAHAGFTFDNYGSRYIEKDRYQLTLSHNNFLGLDDTFTLQYQISGADRYRLTALRYLFPVTETTDVGFFAARTKLQLGREFQDLDARGKSQLFGLYVIQNLVDRENVDVDLNLGFDYKDIFNFQSGTETSRDRLRVLKAGLDFDFSDTLGRTILTDEVALGIPDIMGGLKNKDPRASRSGAGGKFVKNTINLLRLQRMPYSSTLLWKNQFQISPYILTATEQYQIGGIVNVRGYPPAEFVGDKGYSMSWEWSFPVYPLSRNVKVPLSQAKLYDALRVVTFYDWGNVRLFRPQAGEGKNKTLRAAGWGLRFNLPEDFSLRLDFAWPLDNTPTDNNHFHPWVQVSKSF